jgi:hypothetical protein
MSRAAAAIRPEKQLLLSCARTRFDDARAQGIRTLLRGDLDWAYILAAADENSVTPLLYRQLQHAGFAEIPEEIWSELTEKVRRNTIRTLYLAAELVRILEGFRAGGVLAIPYKGPVTAAQAYGDVTLRQFDDMDIIVPQRDLAGASEALASLGYHDQFPEKTSPGAPIPGEYSFVHEAGRSRLELHTERTMRHFPVPIDLDAFRGRLGPVSLNGREVHTFSAEDALPFLCVHGCKDFWGRLAWVADVAELAQVEHGIDWEAAFDSARRLGAGRMLDLGLYLAANLLDAPLPEPIVRRLHSSRALGLLAARVRERLLSDSSASMGIVQRSLYRMRMTDKPLAGVRYWFRLASVPTDDDWPNPRSQSRFATLSAVFRPFRLLRKYGLRRP